MPVVPGAPVTPASLRVLTMDELTLAPPPSSNARAIAFAHGYGIYVDNVGIASPATDRLWLDCPANGDVVIGPRSGANVISTLRLRTNRTSTANANMVLDSGNYTVTRSTSGRKYKVDIQDYQFDKQAILNTRVVSFFDRTEVMEYEAGWSDRVPRRYCGVVAEEVHEAGLELLVGYLDGQPDSVAYDRLTLGLIQVAREQEDRITALEARLAALEAGASSPDPAPEGGEDG